VGRQYLIPIPSSVVPKLGKTEKESTSEPKSEPGRTIVVMPALNAAKTLELIVDSVPRDIVQEVILVDDRSTDETLEIARRLDVSVVWHPHNVGYGGNQKTCYLEALQRGADIVVMLHPDGQYEPELIPKLIEPIRKGEADLVLGSRMMIPGAAKEAGMPLYKRVANRGLTTLENRVLGTQLTDLHTGYRAYGRDFLLTVPFLRNSLDFSFDSEVLMQASHFGFRIREVSARTRYFEDASSVGPWTSTIYGVKTLWSAFRLLLHRSHILPSRKFSP
jgi:glycosyltransferase involved in cell wall biosynthesis